MFNVGFTEILVVALVIIIIIDKDKMPAFVDFIKIVYKYIIRVKFKTKNLLKDAGIEDLYTVEEINYITGKDGKLYPSYNVNGQGNDSKDSSGG